MTTVINTKKVSLMFMIHVMFRDVFGIGQKIYTKYTYYIARPGNGNPPISSFHWHNLFPVLILSLILDLVLVLVF